MRRNCEAKGGEEEMTIGSLFSGIGGLELGLEWSGLGPTFWQVEIDPKPRNCLATHWPEATRYDDIREVGGAELGHVDIICGGFPCQDVSSAGKRAGLAGARSGLWSEFRRVIDERRPRWVCVENVASGATKWVDAVRADLEQLGYASLPIPLSASDCGAWHRRARVFIIAYRDGDILRDEHRGGAGSSREGAALAPRNTQGGKTNANTGCERPGESHSEGHSDSRGGSAWSAPQRGGSLLPDADHEGESPPRWGEREKRRWTCDGSQWTVEPDVARMVHGFPGRVDRERALGNAVVPQCAEVVGHVIQMLDGLLK